jgi:hypothetical protein
VKVGHHPVTVEEDDDLLARESFSILVVLILGSVILFSMLGIGRRTLRSPDDEIFRQVQRKFSLITAEFFVTTTELRKEFYDILVLGLERGPSFISYYLGEDT